MSVPERAKEVFNIHRDTPFVAAFWLAPPTNLQVQQERDTREARDSSSTDTGRVTRSHTQVTVTDGDSPSSVRRRSQSAPRTSTSYSSPSPARASPKRKAASPGDGSAIKKVKEALNFAHLEKELKLTAMLDRSISGWSDAVELVMSSDKDSLDSIRKFFGLQQVKIRALIHEKASLLGQPAPAPRDVPSRVDNTGFSDV